MDKHIHIVTHEIPWPVAHGGLVDLYYKLIYLHKLGIRIHLHCFSKQIMPQPELNKYCTSVHYYKRRRLSGISFKIPYIVYSRRSKALLDELQKDNYPVLLEGIHCTWLLYQNALPKRRIYVRLHNAEHTYYERLAAHETNILKKQYYKTESRLLLSYEAAIADKAVFLAVSSQDAVLYRKKFKAPDVHFIPVFIPFNTVAANHGTGCYCLYHGNLSVSENEYAVIWLIENVFKDLTIPFVVAGRNPTDKLKTTIHKYAHCCLTENPGDKEMQDMINKAQINVLPSFNKTGVKLKILNALYNGRHCLVNEAAIEGAVIHELCSIAESPEQFKEQINKLYNTPFTAEQIRNRQSELQGLYNNEQNALRLMTLIW